MTNHDETTMSYWRQAYDDMLDDMQPDVFGFAASRILHQLDPIAYRCGFYDYIDGCGIDSDTLEDDE